jgi:putative nucleotidyltransferase with HDIG domain
MSEARAGRPLDVARVKDNVESMIDSLFRNRNALAALTNLRQYDDYTFTHSLNVAVIAISVGRHFKLRRDDLRLLGMGGIFHDIGKTGIPEQILNKPGKLDQVEFERIKEHPNLGARMLEKDKNLSPFVLEMVKHHHERVDGSGYPDGLSGGQLETHIIISGLSDVYDALSSDRVYHKGFSPHEALHVLFTLRAKQFPSILVDRFIQALGIYPAGTTVRLNSGEIGVVFAVNQSSLLRPQILLVIDPAGQRIAPARLMDLNEHANHDRDIAEVLDPKTVGVNPAEHFINEMNIL